MSRRISEYHDFVDLLAEKLTRHGKFIGSPVTCQAGCAACCSESVYVHKKEARHAFEAIPDDQYDAVKARVVAWAQVFFASPVSTQGEPHVLEYRALKLACPLLDNQRCLVYAARPTGCRLHLAVGPRDRCDHDDQRLSQKFASSTEGLTAVGVAAINACKGKVETDHLGVFLLEFFTGDARPSAARYLA